MSLEINEHHQVVWYYSKQGSVIGPISFDEIKQLSASGKLLQDDLIWRPGLEQWVQAKEVSGLFTPPPLPPPPLHIANYHVVNAENVNSATLSTGVPIPDESSVRDSGGRKRRSWLLTLMLLCLGIFAFGFFFQKNSSGDIGFLIGYNLPMGLAIWGLFYAKYGRKQGWIKAGLSFLAIYCSLFAGSYTEYIQRKHATIQAVTEIQKEFSIITNSAKDSKGAPQHIEHRADITPKSQGELGEIERFTKTFLNQLTSLHNDYLREMDAIGWDTILDPGRLEEDRTLVESKAMIQKAGVIVNKYREKTQALLKNTRKDIDSLNLSESAKREMLHGFDEGMERSKSQIDAVWDIEARILSEFENIFALLTGRKGAWAISNRQILFYSNRDLNRFNAYSASIQNLAQQQDAIQKRSIETSNDIFNKLKQ